MAITDVFELNLALTSPSYAYKCYIDYEKCGNTMQISEADFKKIQAQWTGLIGKWEAIYAADENNYEIEGGVDGRRWNHSVEEGKAKAAENTGFDGSRKGTNQRIAADCTWAAGSLTGSLLGFGGKKIAEKLGIKATTGAAIRIAGQKAGKKLGEEAIKEAGEKAIKEAAEKSAKIAAEELGNELSEEALKEVGEEALTNAGTGGIKKAGEDALKQQAAKETGKSVGCIIGCTVALATGTAYTVKKPNKDERDALVNLRDTEYVAGANALTEEQGNMEEAASELEDYSLQAEELNDTVNETITDQMTDFYAIRKSYQAYVDMEKSGIKLTAGQESLKKQYFDEMSGMDIQTWYEDTLNKANEDTQDIIDDMEDKQEVFDTSAETMAEVQGLTEYGAGFDTATRTMCWVEGAAQTLNVVSGTKSVIEATSLATSGTWAFGATAWAWAFVAMGTAGVGMSTNGVREQIGWATGDITEAIHAREDLEDFNADTLAQYDERMDDFDGYVDTVNGLEIMEPDDMEVPEWAESNENTPELGNFAGDNANENNIEDDKKDEE